MKKKGVIKWAILGVIVLGLLGYNLYEAHKENEAKEVFLEWFHDVEPEEIRLANIRDTRNVEYDDSVVVELTEEQQEKICKIMKMVTIEEIVPVKEEPDYKNCLDISIYITKSAGEWCLRFDGDDTVYIYGMPQKVLDKIGRWRWEIKNEELVKFCEEISDK